jgi:tonB family C-terminal domain
MIWCGAAAQNETVEPRFQGADVKRFMARLVGETEKVIDETKTLAGELSPRVRVAFTVDTEGNITEWRFLDNTCEGRDSCELEPATERTREVMTTAMKRLERWTPAQKNGEPTTYNWRLTLRIPVEKIAEKQDPDPLLFQGQNPDKTFHKWANARMKYDDRHTARGIEGRVAVRFYVEPDGTITIGEVLEAADEKLSREVIRVIKKSKGLWTPRKVRGVPQRSPYVYRINFFMK